MVERKSNGILVYDVRVTGRLVGWLDGRNADTNQRLSVQTFDAGERGTEIWAGSTDGIARVWNWQGLGGVGDGEASGLKADWEWKAHGSAVTAVAVHGSGSVVATSSGERRGLSLEHHDSDSDSDGQSESEVMGSDSAVSETPPDNSIKIWKL